MTLSSTSKHIHHHGNMSHRLLIIIVIAAGLVLLAFASMLSADTKQYPDQVIAETTEHYQAISFCR